MLPRLLPLPPACIRYQTYFIKLTCALPGEQSKSTKTQGSALIGTNYLLTCLVIYAGLPFKFVSDQNQRILRVCHICDPLRVASNLGVIQRPQSKPQALDGEKLSKQSRQPVRVSGQRRSASFTNSAAVKPSDLMRGARSTVSRCTLTVPQPRQNDVGRRPRPATDKRPASGPGNFLAPKSILSSPSLKITVPPSSRPQYSSSSTHCF
jgi:hypothetical protein